MKKIKRMMAIAIAIAIGLTMMSATCVFSDNNPGTPSITIKPNNSSNVTTNPTITYTYYKILNADIGTDPVVSSDGSTTTAGVAAYYVTNQDQATALSNTGVFSVTKVGNSNKWYVALVEGKGVQDIITAFNDADFLSKFTAQTYTSDGFDAVLPDVSAGYYFIKSSLGSKMAVQTLSPVTINEKNEYITDDKTIPEVDKNSEIGQEITYTLTVNVPVTATEQIVLTDTMSKGLTFKEVKSQKIGDNAATDAQKGEVSGLSDDANGAKKFTITYTADQVKALVADGTAKTINIEVTVIVNEEAAIDTDIPNTLDLKYGNNYDAVPVTVCTV